MSAKATLTIGQARRALAQSLTEAGIESADTDARILVSHALGLDRAALTTRSEHALSADESRTIDMLAARRLKREPVSRILGAKEFWSLPLAVNAAVLVPRPETETVVELALDLIERAGARMERLRILDIGTGSGAIALALLTELPNASATLTDISEAALAVARANAETHGLAPRCGFVICDIAEGIDGPFDLIVSNPPYIAHADIAALEPEVRDHDPRLALDGGVDGLDAYRAIAAYACRLLAPGGWSIVELGFGQEAAVSALFNETGLTVTETRADLAAIPRALAAQKSR